MFTDDTILLLYAGSSDTLETARNCHEKLLKQRVAAGSEKD